MSIIKYDKTPLFFLMSYIYIYIFICLSYVGACLLMPHDKSKKVVQEKKIPKFYEQV
jgi:hypothetical protein